MHYYKLHHDHTTGHATKAQYLLPTRGKISQKIQISINMIPLLTARTCAMEFFIMRYQFSASLLTSKYCNQVWKFGEYVRVYHSVVTIIREVIEELRRITRIFQGHQFLQSGKLFGIFKHVTVMFCQSQLQTIKQDFVMHFINVFPFLKQVQNYFNNEGKNLKT